MLKILLIDDDEELCVELKELMEAEGFKLDIVLNGSDGLEHLRKRRHDIIILDLKLPGVNGYEILKEIRRIGSDFKVVVLSGRPIGEPLLKEKGLSLEEEEKVLHMANHVINKPFRIDEFVARIKELAKGMVEKSQ